MDKDICKPLLQKIVEIEENYYSKKTIFYHGSSLLNHISNIFFQN